MLTPLLVCLLVLLGLGGLERLARDRALRAVPIRIHVNGTRAKSTVTRLIWSALAESGITAIAKTTGTAARILMPDRREIPVARRGPANIREQLGFLRLARRAGARAAVVECMAIDPVLQQVTERNMIRATVGVITNVRPDHTEVMGRDLPSIASSLANTIPVGAVLVTGPSPHVELFRERAGLLGTSVVTAEPVAAELSPGDRHLKWLSEDTALALAVTRQLGIDDATARRGFALAPPDPGTVKDGSARVRRGHLMWLDATAANDPLSLALLLEDFGPWRQSPAGKAARPARVLVYQHRPDRVARLECFISNCPEFSASDAVAITGARPPLTVWRELVRIRPGGGPEFVAPSGLAIWLAHRAPATVVFCGNTRGLDVPRLVEEAVARG